jgi:transposase
MAKRPPRPPLDPKAAQLHADGTLNRRAAQVTDPVFRAHDFFDARDVVQVKYEMLRRVEIEAQPVAPTAVAFHLSRPSFYQAQRAFQERGLAGLLPQKRGPRGGHKVTPDLLAFVQQRRAEDPALRPPALVQQIANRFGITVHPRSIERALARVKKKRPR